MKINLLKCGKAILTIILAFSVLAVSLFTGAFAVSAGTVTDVWDGSSDTEFAVADETAEAGTATNPYIISTAAELYGMVASGGNGKYYKVADGIDKFVLNAVDGMSKEDAVAYFTNEENTPNKWYHYSTWPDGDHDKKTAFSGHFDGNGATIVGLYGKGDYHAHLGFIPYVENQDVTVENVKFENAYIYSEDTRGELGSAVVIGTYNTNAATNIRVNNVSVVNSTVRDNNAAAIMGYSAVTANVAPRCQISNIVTANNTITCNADSADRYGVVFGFYSFWAGNTTTQLSNMILADDIQFASNAEFLGNSATYSFVSFSNVYTVGTKPSEDYAYAGVTFGINADTLTDAAAMETASALSWGKDFVAMENSVPDLAIFHNVESVSVGKAGHVVMCTDEGCTVISSQTAAHTVDANGICSACGYVSGIRIWDGTSDTEFAVADETAEAGTEANPYIITSPAELYGMVASGGNGKYYKVADGIDRFVLNSEGGTQKWYHYSTWAQAPTDYNKKPFSGHFDGNGVIIDGLYGTGDWEAHLGFIPFVQNSDVTVENVKFQNAYIYSEDTRGEYGSAVVIGNYYTNAATTIKINNVSVVNSTVKDMNASAIVGYSVISDGNAAPTVEISNIVTAGNTITGNDAARQGVIFGYYNLYNGNTNVQLSDMILADNIQFASNAEALANAEAYINLRYENVYTAGAKPADYAYAGVTFDVDAQTLKGATAMETANTLGWGSDFVAMTESLPDLAVFHNMKSVADGEAGHSYKCEDEDCAVIATDMAPHNYVNGSCEDCGYTHEHDFTSVPETPATCSTDGVKAHRVCSIDICEGLKYDVEEAVVVTDADLKIAADATVVENHSYDTGNVQYAESKCDGKDDKAYYDCVLCDKYIVDDTVVDTIPVPDHDIAMGGRVESNCEGKPSISYGVCSTCEKYIIDGVAYEELPEAPDHDYTDGVVESNCEAKEDIAYGYCDACDKYLVGDEFKDELPAAPDHVYDNDLDVDCNDCSDIREVADHWIDNADGTKSYYKDGVLIKSNWLNLGTWYYFDANGIMCTGWKQVSGTWYYFASSGAMQTGWVKDGGTWYYCDANGAMQTGWLKDGGTWYYLNADGVMCTGWKQVSGTWYYFASSGAMQTGWQQVGGTWYYFASGGAMQTGWQQVGGTWYYFASSGAMQTGWQQVSGTWYYFASSGAMQTGWQLIGGTWYYFASSGAMHTGWLNLGGTWYYMYSSGAMATNIYISGGYINSSGIWS